MRFSCNKAPITLYSRDCNILQVELQEALCLRYQGRIEMRSAKRGETGAFALRKVQILQVSHAETYCSCKLVASICILIRLTSELWTACSCRAKFLAVCIRVSLLLDPFTICLARDPTLFTLTWIRSHNLSFDSTKRLRALETELVIPMTWLHFVREEVLTIQEPPV